LFDLTGNVAIITGSTKGIGYAIAKKLLENGVKIIVNSRKSEEEVQTVLKELKTIGEYVYYIKADVSIESEAQVLVNEAVKQFGKIDILINNVGTTKVMPATMAKTEALYNLYNANILSALFMTKFTLKKMIINKYGRIINISSVAGTNGRAMQSAYATCKAGLIGYTKSIAIEWGTKNITCNAIVPGVIKTHDVVDEKVEQYAVERTPVKRIGTPDDIAGAVVFLASKEASFITGQALKIDGGMWM
jgi:3-oxoacyl-[acyl-carrier protein] reductase